MNGAYPGEEFIVELNGKAQGRNAAFSCSEEEERDFRWKPPVFEYAFTRPIDLVLIGPCSFGYVTPSMPNPVLVMAAFVTNQLEAEFEPNARRDRIESTDFFDDALCCTDERRTVVVFSGCCGQYDLNQQKRLRDKYPLTEWIFPRHSDFCACPGASRLAYALSENGLLIQSAKAS